MFGWLCKLIGHKLVPTYNDQYGERILYGWYCDRCDHFVENTKEVLRVQKASLERNEPFSEYEFEGFGWVRHPRKSCCNCVHIENDPDGGGWCKFIVDDLGKEVWIYEEVKLCQHFELEARRYEERNSK